MINDEPGRTESSSGPVSEEEVESEAGSGVNRVVDLSVRTPWSQMYQVRTNFLLSN